jgi:hypothetical protein
MVDAVNRAKDVPIDFEAFFMLFKKDKNIKSGYGATKKINITI